MKRHGARGAMAIAILLMSSAGVFGRPHAEKTQHVSPSIFGRVFEQNRAALVQVRCGETAWATGFLIGARGEVVFGTQTSPVETLTIRMHDGAERTGTLLGYEADLHLGVARIDGSFTPMRVAQRPGLLEKRWVVVLKHDAKGRAEPFAGVVEADAAVDAAKKRKIAVAPVSSPAARGSPVLSPEGELVGVALDEGARSTRVVAIETIVPFLKKVVLGGRD